jgi:hypothetical protein
VDELSILVLIAHFIYEQGRLKTLLNIQMKNCVAKRFLLSFLQEIELKTMQLMV